MSSLSPSLSLPTVPFQLEYEFQRLQFPPATDLHSHQGLPTTETIAPFRAPRPSLSSLRLLVQKRPKTLAHLKSMESSATYSKGFDQNLIVMRHGHRLDNFDETWETKAERPWDPPLTEKGFETAFEVGRQLKNLSLPIHRVFVSPFLRCVQTASKVVAALCTVDENDPLKGIDPSRVKVSIEYGLCEVLNNFAIRHKVAPMDGDFRFNIPALEAMLPDGTVDHTVDRIYQELPRWGESNASAKNRYEQVIQVLANKHPSEKLLLVTHGDGVGTWTSLLRGAEVVGVDYCAYSHAVRRVVFTEDKSFTAGSFELLGIGPYESSMYFAGSRVSDGL
ncbi:hypothetical protein Nepgr_019054 [Nepenthes gracilis]|uniref:Uncharacterized protein n=1 Tax=Nepenthes gracilis TaxID=150966 RepID=A0AAD3STB7_NEPGR|nr:hypothetical protein Nepgr_019054 [Nepenthes gracilis]